MINDQMYNKLIEDTIQQMINDDPDEYAGMSQSELIDNAIEIINYNEELDL